MVEIKRRNMHLPGARDKKKKKMFVLSRPIIGSSKNQNRLKNKRVKFSQKPVFAIFSNMNSIARPNEISQASFIGKKLDVPRFLS